VPINIGGLPEQLIESELFGHERGAFTGADARKQGMIEVADGGTVFLDEIGEMPMHLQVKLLRVLQDRRIQRLGATRSVPVDVRFIAATNADLESRVAEGRFREDLFYRLNVIRIKVPPLRERPEDIALLARHFVSELRRRTGSHVTGMSADAIRALGQYRFPGNVRELQNMVERAVILSDSEELSPSDFDLPEPGEEQQHGGGSGAAGSSAAGSGAGGGNAEMNQRPVSAGPQLRHVERETIAAALERNAWHRERTAKQLGITRRTLLNKIKEYGIERSPR
jgi:two-component system response regulator AtoC